MKARQPETFVSSVTRNSPPPSGFPHMTSDAPQSQRTSNLHTGTACEVCGNEYDKPLEIVANGISHYFDSFECAIQAMAPRCAHCDCRIIGHGLESGGQMFCCAHCASEKGVTTLKDRT